MNINTVKQKAILATLLAACFVAPSSVMADDWKFHAAGTIATKSMDDDGWQAENIADLTLMQDAQFGGLFDMKKSSWPVAIVADIFVTADKRKANGFEETATTSELHLGVRKYWGTPQQGWQSYLGGGIALTSTDLESKFGDSKTSDDDSDTGVWLGGGANWHLTEKWYVGLDVRYSTGTLNVFEQERDVDGFLTGLTVGLAW